MASGSSERGLSLVATTKSLPSPAACPIFGRLVRSRSPPQPNSVITRPPSCSRHLARQRRQIAQRVVGVGIVHNHRKRLARINRLKAPGNRLEPRHKLHKLRERHAARMSRRQRRQQIENVHFAGQPRSHLGRTRRSFNSISAPLGVSVWLAARQSPRPMP